MNRELQQILLRMERRDREVRAQLLNEGRLFHGYDSDMERVHIEHAHALEKIIDQFGWPGITLTGEEGAQAAWFIAQHAISVPEFQRKALALISDAVQRGDVPARHMAYLTDRIRYNERRPQVYGIIFDWDEQGQMSPWTFEAPETIDERRADVGLEPLHDIIAQARAGLREANETAPASYARRQLEIETWARKAGWIE